MTCPTPSPPWPRGQLWWVYDQLEVLRLMCINLLRRRTNFAAEAEGHNKVEFALPIEQLALLEAACCPLERGAMLQAAHVLLRFYQDLAPGPDLRDRVCG